MKKIFSILIVFGLIISYLEYNEYELNKAREFYSHKKDFIFINTTIKEHLNKYPFLKRELCMKYPLVDMY
jgi:hypothetical protein